MSGYTFTASVNGAIYDAASAPISAVDGNLSLASLTNWRALLWHDVTRPIVNISYAVDHALWGATPFGYHLTSVLLHALNVALLFALVRAWVHTDERDVVAFTAAACGALVPRTMVQARASFGPQVK